MRQCCRDDRRLGTGMVDKYSIRKLEYNTTHHCNLRCDSCDHLSPFFGPKDVKFDSSISLVEFNKQLDILSRYVCADELLIVGGEPLLRENILEFMKSVRRSNIAKKTVLVTNGFLLHKQNDELFDLVDKITISLYPSMPLRKDLVEQARARCARHSVELELFVQPKFSMSIVGIKTENATLVDGIFNTCHLAWTQRCYALHDGYVYRCSRAPFIGYKLYSVGLVERDFSKDDGLKVEDSEDFGARIAVYFNRPTALKSCAYCLGSVGKRIQHRQLSKTEIQDEAWATHSIDDSIDRAMAFRKLTMWRWLKVR